MNQKCHSWLIKIQNATKQWWKTLNFLFNCLIHLIVDNPIVTLKMGSSLNPDDIKEGADVYFECLIQSNPKPYKMSWFHNVSFSRKFAILRTARDNDNDFPILTFFYLFYSLLCWRLRIPKFENYKAKEYFPFFI